MTMTQIHPIPAFTDNYLWLLQQAPYAAVVDPGDADVILSYLQHHELTLCAILITHHHLDHIAGVSKLAKHYPKARIIGPDDSRLNLITTPVSEGSQVDIPELSLTLTTWHTPGHTRSHVIYHNEQHLFCADVLFSAGCGRLFEGTAQQMLFSLTRLASLPDSILCYPAHEYTLSNLEFAKFIDPNNPDIDTYIAACQQWRNEDKPTLPTTIGLEKKINPFLRCHLSELQNSASAVLNLQLHSTLDTFKAIRAAKDQF